MSTTTMTGAELDLTQLHDVLESLRRGNFSKRLPTDLSGRAGMIARTLNATMEMLATFKAEHLRVADEIGTQGELGGQMEIFSATGGWQELTDAMNRMAANLTVELRRTSHVAAAAAQGNTTPRLTAQLIAGEVASMQKHVQALADRAAPAARP